MIWDSVVIVSFGVLVLDFCSIEASRSEFGMRFKNLRPGLLWCVALAHSRRYCALGLFRGFLPIRGYMFYVNVWGFTLNHLSHRLRRLEFE